MDDTGASAKADQALAVPVEPVSRLDPSGFDPSRFEALARSCQESTGRRRELDVAITMEIYGADVDMFRAAETGRFSPTGSVDVALSFVPPDTFSRRALNVALERDDDSWGAAIWHPFAERPRLTHAVTPALAMCAAALNAIAMEARASPNPSRQDTSPSSKDET
jgi:hypothetical protein